MSGLESEEFMDLKRRVNNLEARLSPLRDDVTVLRERVDRLDAGVETVASTVKKLEGFNLASLDESVLYRIAKALEGVLEFKKEFAKDPEAWRKQGRQDVDSGIDIWGVKWLQRNRDEAPENPMWGWAFAYDRDGGYLPESRELVRYLEEHGEYHQDGYVMKLGGSKGRLLQLSRGNRDSG